MDNRKDTKKVIKISLGKKKSPDNVEVYGDNVKVKRLEPISEDIEQFQELEDELEEIDTEELPERAKAAKKEGVLKRFMGFFRGDDVEYIEEDVVLERPEVDEDVKTALKIALRWIEKLPKSRLREFKSSGDADKFKEVLINQGLAKEKTLDQKI